MCCHDASANRVIVIFSTAGSVLGPFQSHRAKQKRFSLSRTFHIALLYVDPVDLPEPNMITHIGEHII